MISGFEDFQLKTEITKSTWDKDPEGHTNLGKVYKESSSVSGHAGWIIKRYEDLWNEFSTQQVSHENRHLQCKSRAQALQHDCQIQASQWWINPLFPPLTNIENIRNKECEVFFNWPDGLRNLSAAGTPKAPLSNYEHEKLFYCLNQGWDTHFSTGLHLDSHLACLLPISMFFLWFLSSSLYFPEHPGGELFPYSETISKISVEFKRVSVATDFTSYSAILFNCR